MNLKEKFSIFENYKKANGKDLIYLDSAASSLTPDSVVQKANEYYFNYRSNVDRAISDISQKATHEYNEARGLLAKYLNCSTDDLIWTSGATASSNLIIDLITQHNKEYNFLYEDDEILTTILEHHSSLLPLQKLAKETRMKIKFLELDNNFELDTSNLKSLVTEKTKILSITLASNVTGTINNIKSIIKEVKEINKEIFVISDMTAAFGHMYIDMRELGKYVDAAYFSFHKAFGPTGVGVLYLNREFSRRMTPVQLGGGIISHVEKEAASYRSDIKAFEPGTPNIAGVIGAGEAIRFLIEIEKEAEGGVLEHNQSLVYKALKKLSELNFKYKNILEVKIFSTRPENNIGIISFQTLVNGKEIHPHDVAEILARDEISVRAGHHCAEPLMNYLGTPSGLTRVSFHIYNNEDDIEKLIDSLKKVKEIFGK